MRKHYLLLLLLSLLSVANVTSQNQQIVLSEAEVRRGDDPAWKGKDYNEKGWQIIQLNRDWDSQGFGDYDGVAFYRKRFTLPSDMLKQSLWKDSLIFYMGKIDDADEVYLNGKLIGKTGRFPNDQGGYQGSFDVERFYKVAANDPAVEWDKENVLAIRVYDGSGLGGMTEGFPYIRMVDLMDELSVKTSFNKNKQGDICTVSITNGHGIQVSGTLNIDVIDTENNTTVKTYKQKAKLLPKKALTKEIPYSPDKRYCVRVTFVEDKTQLSLTKNVIVPYILTPKAADSPQINGAKVFGVRPDSPFFFKIPVSGQKPMKYSVENLPSGLTVDNNTGIITGTLNKEGDYKMTFVAENAKGKNTREFTLKVGDLLCLTPPMGWNSWNCWGITVSDERVRSSAQALVDKGLMDYGWMYINIDDAWENDKRDQDGTLRTNSKFPDMKALGSWLHSQGLRMGIYSSPGGYTCGRYLGSYQHERQDADMWASWGVDYLKYDWCGYGEVYDKEQDHSLSAHLKPYQVMEKALNAQKRDIVYSLCQYGMREVWQWGAATNGNLWRTTGDIVDTWDSFREIGFDGQARLSEFARPGRWNDPDMLVVGKVGWGDKLRDTRLTYDEQYTHISLWSLLASPLLIGCDISQMDDFTLNLLTNAEVIAINQDPLGKQARRLIEGGDKQVWVKPLEDGGHAVGIFNLGNEDKEMDVKWSDLHLPDNAAVRDLWRQKDLGKSTGTFHVKVPSHGVVLLKVN